MPEQIIIATIIEDCDEETRELLKKAAPLLVGRDLF